MNNSHQTAETKFVEAERIKFAYRRFGTDSRIPVIFLQHIGGTMDGWDPAVTDGIAKEHQVILFDNRGVSSTNGKAPDNVDAMADDAIAFIEALSLDIVDILGFSLGGFVAQRVAFKKPSLIRKMILVGTGPQGSAGLDGLPETFSVSHKKGASEGLIWLFFTDSEESQKRGHEFWSRLNQRTLARDPDISAETFERQMKAIVDWGAAVDKSYHDLKAMNFPVLIVNGSSDKVIPTKNSYILFEQLNDGWLSLYPDSGHGSFSQYPKLFVEEVTGFLK